MSSKADGYLETFGADFNQRFARAPHNPHDAHRLVRADEDLAVIFTWQEDRSLSQFRWWPLTAGGASRAPSGENARAS